MIRALLYKTEISFEKALAALAHKKPDDAALPLLVVTLNPEMALAAEKDDELRDIILHRADFVLPDGIGTVLASRLFGHPVQERISGIDFAERIFSATSYGITRIMLIGGKKGVAEKAAMQLKRRFPHCTFAGFSDIRIDETGSALNIHREEEVTSRIAEFKPEVLLVGFGVTKQEKWLTRNLTGFQEIKIVIGVGGAPDIWAGRLPRAPRIMRKIGCEWLWRVLIEPKRLPRIINAVVIFLLFALIEKLLNARHET